MCRMCVLMLRRRHPESLVDDASCAQKKEPNQKLTAFPAWLSTSTML